MSRRVTRASRSASVSSLATPPAITPRRRRSPSPNGGAPEQLQDPLDPDGQARAFDVHLDRHVQLLQDWRCERNCNDAERERLETRLNKLFTHFTRELHPQDAAVLKYRRKRVEAVQLQQRTFAAYASEDFAEIIEVHKILISRWKACGRDEFTRRALNRDIIEYTKSLIDGRDAATQRQRIAVVQGLLLHKPSQQSLPGQKKRKRSQ